MIKKLFFVLILCSGLVFGNLHLSPERVLAQGEDPGASPTGTETPTEMPPTLAGTATQTPMAPAAATQTPVVQATATSASSSVLNIAQSSSDLIFADSFESGNLSAWTANSIDKGDLTVSTAAALAGSQGLQAVIDDNNTIHVRDDSPNAEPRYLARFYFDPNSIPMANGNAHIIFKGFAGAS
ncbi:MAG TPA: hypothetical protein VFO91_05360, partial [Anaerolineales bacterium]|nr:hypothetical protein [Anaerolineales bacterium]